MDSWAAAADTADDQQQVAVVVPFLVRKKRRRRRRPSSSGTAGASAGAANTASTTNNALSGNTARSEIESLKHALQQSQDKTKQLCKLLRDLLKENEDERRLLEKRIEALEEKHQHEKNVEAGSTISTTTSSTTTNGGGVVVVDDIDDDEKSADASLTGAGFEGEDETADISSSSEEEEESSEEESSSEYETDSEEESSSSSEYETDDESSEEGSSGEEEEAEEADNKEDGTTWATSTTGTSTGTGEKKKKKQQQQSSCGSLSLSLSIDEEEDESESSSSSSSKKSSSENKHGPQHHQPPPLHRQPSFYDQNNNILRDLKITSRQFITQRSGRFSEHYTIEGLIKSGSYGLVASCRHNHSQQLRCVKELKKSKRNQESNAKVIHEFNVLRGLDHPNILKMNELFEDKKHYYIVTELCEGGDLLDALRERKTTTTTKCGNGDGDPVSSSTATNLTGPFNEHDTALFMVPVLSCLNYSHSKRLIHRDIKPSNCVLEANKPLDQIKLIDFGEAIYYTDDELPLTEFAGTLSYMAPEVCNTCYTSKCDIWSVGVIAYQMLTGTNPFKGADDAETFKNILQKELKFDEPIWKKKLSSRAKDFVSRLLRRNDTDRPSAAEALQHPWIKSVQQRRSCLVRGSESARNVLSNMSTHTSHHNNKFQQATSTFIASQLLLKQEKEQIDEVFRCMDTDADGRLTKDDIREGYEKVYGVLLSESEINQMFDKIDLDGGGYIGYSEFVVASTHDQELFSRKNLKQAFDAFDKDCSGGISPAELMNMFQSSVSELDESFAIGLVESIDKDGNGEVSFEEFAEIMLHASDEHLNLSQRGPSMTVQ